MFALLTFGPYKGKFLTEVPLNYIFFLLSCEEPKTIPARYVKIYHSNFIGYTKNLFELADHKIMFDGNEVSLAYIAHMAANRQNLEAEKFLADRMRKNVWDF